MFPEQMETSIGEKSDGHQLEGSTVADHEENQGKR